MFIGHQIQQEYFEKVLARGGKAHGYFFYGASHVGKRTFARALAAYLQSAQNIKLTNYFSEVATDTYFSPDLYEITGDLPIKELRQLRSVLQRSPYSAPLKVLIVDEAQKLRGEGANTLLKILEEPAGDTLFFMISPAASSIIETIRSRLVQISFAEVSDVQIKAHFETSDIEDLRHYWSGRPGLVARLLADRGLCEYFRRMEKTFNSFAADSLRKRFLAVDEYLSGDIIFFLDNWISRERNLNNTELLKRLFAARKTLATGNANPKYILHNLAINT